MIAFAAVATLLAVVLVGWLLWPARRRREVSTREANISIYRDQRRELDADLAAGKIAQEDYERSRREIERRVLEDVAVTEAPVRRAVPWPAIAIIPVLAIAVYFLVGSPRMIQQEAEHAVTAQQVEAMVARLAAKLRENPDDVDGWKLLGRSYGALGRFEESANAYAQAATRAPRDAQLLADFADALAMARGQTLQGEPEQLVQRALEIDPKNLKALALLGTAAFERKDFQRAAEVWKRMLDVVPPGSEDARAIQGNVDEALALKDSRVLRGEVRLSEKLKAQASPDDLVYIFARAVEGPPMPLAVARKRVRDLPASFALDDTMAMAPGAKLSNYPRVVVSARVSKSGNANPQAGDLQGASPAVANDASGVRVVIDSVVR
jgi:cytochrome c-type biogenesis protein CcmH